MYRLIYEGKCFCLFVLAAGPCPCFWHRWFADQREASRFVCGGSSEAVWGNKINPRGSRLWQQVRSLLIKCQLPRWMWFVTLRRPLHTIYHMIPKGRLKALRQTKHFEPGWRFCRPCVRLSIHLLQTSNLKSSMSELIIPQTATRSLEKGACAIIIREFDWQVQGPRLMVLTQKPFDGLRARMRVLKIMLSLSN